MTTHEVNDVVRMLTSGTGKAVLSDVESDDDLHSVWSQPTPNKERLDTLPSILLTPEQKKTVTKKFFTQQSPRRSSPRTSYIRGHYKQRPQRKARRRLRMSKPVAVKTGDVKAPVDYHNESLPAAVDTIDEGRGLEDDGIADVSHTTISADMDENSRESSDKESGISCGSSVKSHPASSSKQAWDRLLDRKKQTPDRGTKRKMNNSNRSLVKGKKSKVEDAKDTKEQSMLDAGQSRFGAVQCNVCGMLYGAAEQEDEMLHKKFHDRILHVTKFSGWKHEKVEREYMQGRVIRVNPDDFIYAKKKVEELLKIVDSELGYVVDDSQKRMRTTYLYISDDKRIEGCCVVEPISHAYRIIPDDHHVGSSIMSSSSCSIKPVEAVCGVNRIWTLPSCRRKGVATLLLNTLRDTFLPTVTIERDGLAFSDPTVLGKAFAAHYSGRPDFLVYTYRH